MNDLQYECYLPETRLSVRQWEFSQKFTQKKDRSTDEFKPKLVKVFNYSDECKEIIEIDFQGYGTSGGRKGNVSNLVSKADRERNYKRIKRNCRRLCLANDLGQIHVVLTYKQNMQDVDKADKHFKDFIYALRQIYPSLLYIATREFQERGAIHYHILFNQRVDIKKLNLFWNKQEVKRADHTLEGFRGFVDVVPHTSQIRAVMYVLKYISKEVGESILKTAKGHTRKAYLSSHGLKNEVTSCTAKFIINSTEGYAEYNDGLNFLITNIPAIWDLPIEVEIEPDKILKGRSVLCCVDKPV